MKDVSSTSIMFPDLSELNNLLSGKIPCRCSKTTLIQQNATKLTLIVLSLMKVNLRSFLIYLLGEGSLLSAMRCNIFLTYQGDHCNWWIYEAVNRSVSAITTNCFFAWLGQSGERLQQFRFLPVEKLHQLTSQQVSRYLCSLTVHQIFILHRCGKNLR